MTSQDHDRRAGGRSSDAELLAATRSGDDEAFAALWSRHESAARRLALQLAPAREAEDLVSEAFARILAALRGGGGPDSAFRAYLLSTVRRLTIDAGRRYHGRVVLTDDPEDLDGEAGDSSPEQAWEDHAERRAAWAAWQSLPEDTRLLLWHLVVEEDSPARLAPLLGTTANAVASRGKRARERLRQAFLAQHVAASSDPQCRRARGLFGGHLRGALPDRDLVVLGDHLATCPSCPAALADLTETQRSLRLGLGALVLGSPELAEAYVGQGLADPSAAALSTDGGGVTGSGSAWGPVGVVAAAAALLVAVGLSVVPDGTGAAELAAPRPTVAPTVAPTARPTVRLRAGGPEESAAPGPADGALTSAPPLTAQRLRATSRPASPAAAAQVGPVAPPGAPPAPTTGPATVPTVPTPVPTPAEKPSTTPSPAPSPTPLLELRLWLHVGLGGP